MTLLKKKKLWKLSVYLNKQTKNYILLPNWYIYCELWHLIYWLIAGENTYLVLWASKVFLVIAKSNQTRERKFVPPPQLPGGRLQNDKWKRGALVATFECFQLLFAKYIIYTVNCCLIKYFKTNIILPWIWMVPIYKGAYILFQCK